MFTRKTDEIYTLPELNFTATPQRRKRRWLHAGYV